MSNTRARTERNALPLSRLPDLSSSVTSNERREQLLAEAIEEAEDALSISKGDLDSQLNSVAVDWKPLRNCRECQCGSSLEGTATTKTHCRKCGLLFCRRCARQKAALPGHASDTKYAVCNACYKEVTAAARSADTNGNNGHAKEAADGDGAVAEQAF